VGDLAAGSKPQFSTSAGEKTRARAPRRQSEAEA